MLLLFILTANQLQKVINYRLCRWMSSKSEEKCQHCDWFTSNLIAVCLQGKDQVLIDRELFQDHIVGFPEP